MKNRTKKNTLIVVLTIVLVVSMLTSYHFFVSEDTIHAPIVNSNLPEIIITMTDQGFRPESVTVKIGQKVTWKNTGTSTRWPASDSHPTHSHYPGSSITKCDTEEEITIFDSCRAIQQGQSYSFVFSDAGEWRYHDHLQSRLLGKITVVK